MNEILFRDVWWIFAVLAVASYFVGCFNFALLISKIKHKDVRKMGSGNPGTMNMSRQFGLKIGAATLFLDMFKGGTMVLVGYFVFRGKVFAGTDFLVSDLARYVCGVCVIVGHIYPVTMKFKGGKGIASTLGMFWFALTCDYWWMFFAALGILVLTLLYIFKSEWGSMGSLFGVSLLTVAQGLIFYFRYAGGTERSLCDRGIHASCVQLFSHLVCAPQKYRGAFGGRRTPHFRQKTFAREEGKLKKFRTK